MKPKRENALSAFDHIKSHPEKPLFAHLSHVADACAAACGGICMDGLAPAFVWKNILWLLGMCHDIAKATSFFQAYLDAENEAEKEKMKKRPETGHGLFSAVVAYYAASSYMACIDAVFPLKPIVPYLMFLSIKKHHGNFRNAFKGKENDNDELYTTDKGGVKALNAQKNAMDEGFFAAILETMGKRLEINLSIKDLPACFESYFTGNIRRKENNKNYDALRKDITVYIVFLYMHSVLIHADKTDAALNGINLPIEEMPGRRTVMEHIAGKFGPPKGLMNAVRADIFKKTHEAWEKHKNNSRIFSLNVPTGSGKTLTCLSLALHMANSGGNGGNKEERRIIYALPFTSIIDQNHDVFRDVLCDPPVSLLLKHHHLSEIAYEASKTNEEFEPAQAKLLMESWESKIVVTTFFQVFHSVFTNRNRMLVKFHKFSGAILILDEIQALPYKYWGAARETLLAMAHLLDMRILLVTATKPRIFRDDEIIELAENKEEYFKQMDRVTLSFDPEKIPIDRYIEKCRQAVTESGESFLFVMNTIKSSMALFNGLRGFDADYYYLSTNIIPMRRLERINGIRRNKNRKIIVSTQMVEAGVDIDVENVWRDFAPLESIAQVAGRCNRNFSERKGSVRVCMVTDPDNGGKPFSGYIYGKNALGVFETNASFGNKSVVDESAFLQMMDGYYKAIQKGGRREDSLKLTDSMKRLAFEDIYQMFRLIEEQGMERKEVFIEIDDDATETWRLFEAAFHVEDAFERKAALDSARRNMNPYMLSVPSAYVKEEEWRATGIVRITPVMMDGAYDETTGWIRTTDDFKTYLI